MPEFIAPVFELSRLLKGEKPGQYQGETHTSLLPVIEAWRHQTAVMQELRAMVAEGNWRDALRKVAKAEKEDELRRTDVVRWLISVGTEMKGSEGGGEGSYLGGDDMSDVAEEEEEEEGYEDDGDWEVENGNEMDPLRFYLDCLVRGVKDMTPWEAEQLGEFSIGLLSSLF